MESKEIKQINITNRNRLTDKENKLEVTSGERDRGRGKIGVVQTIMYKK